MVPIIRPDIPTHKIDNIQHLIIKQKQFLDKMYYGKSYDFTEVDYENKDLKLSMRDMIMQLRTLDGTDSKLFWSLDLDPYDNGYILSYPKFLDSHARDIISQLPSLLAFTYGPEALTMMTEAAQERAIEAPWDIEAMCAISNEDKALAAMRDRAKAIRNYTDPDAESSDDSDDDIDYQKMVFEMNTRETDAYLFKKASTNDSIDTLGTKPQTQKNEREDDTSVDESITATPSPSKKQKASSSTASVEDDKIQRMLRYFEEHNINLDTLEVASVTTATQSATNSLHEQADMDTTEDKAVSNVTAPSTDEKDGVPPQTVGLPPGPVTGLGEGP